MRQLTSLDAQFLAVEDARTYGHVGGLAVYDPSGAPGGKLEVADICRLVSERLHLLPPFRWRLVSVPFGLDLPYWAEDPDFNLDFHIRETAIPPPGTDRQLAATVARIFARPLDRTRPLWELYVIRGLPDGRIALLTKVHHSAADGISGQEILSVLLDRSPEGEPVPPPEEDSTAGERVPRELEMLVRGAAGLARQPLRALRAMPRAVPNLTELPGANAFPLVPQISAGLEAARRVVGRRPQDPALLEVTTARPPRTCFNGPVSQHRSFAFGQVSLDRVKAVKNAAKVTVNDVVVTLCATSVRNWLLERDELPSDPLVALVPVSIRTDEQRADFGNRVSGMIVPIPTNIEEPGERLRQAHEWLRGAKERHQGLPADLMTDATAFIPPALGALAARTTMGILGRTRPPLNLVISNVPGPREPLYMAGAQLEAHYPVSAVVSGVGLNMTIMSYRDHIDFGVVADRDQIAETAPLVEGCQAALDELEDAVCGGARQPETVGSSTLDG